MAKLLDIKGLRVCFEGDGGILTRAVDGIDLTVSTDEVVGLVGESGSGKTMTAFSIMRLVPQGGYIESGSILFEGENILKLNRQAMLGVRGRKISMIFQELFTSLNPVIPVGEQVSEIMAVRRSLSKKEADDEALKLLDKACVKEAARVFREYPHRLSGGQRQRVMIAMALALNPKLLIADEPTTALDVTIQAEILKLLLELKEEYGMSILFITHDFGVVNAVADRVVVMKEGKIVERGAKNVLLRSPAHPYTKKLLAAIPKIDASRGSIQKGGKELINIKSVTKVFSLERGPWHKKAGVVKAIDGVNLRLVKGRTLGLVGESASGKTTLAKVILGLLKPDRGEVIVDGIELSTYIRKTPKKVRKMMQIVFQDPYSSLDPHMKMGEIVMEGPDILNNGAAPIWRPSRRKEKESILRDVLEKTSLNYEDRYKYPHQFSGGQRQRIAIARALAVEPKFLVLDEPVSSLDLSIQSDILELLKALQYRLGLTYLFISHDLRVVGSISDEVAVMYQGRIVEYAQRDVIYKNPHHPYTKRLLASIQKI